MCMGRVGCHRLRVQTPTPGLRVGVRPPATRPQIGSLSQSLAPSGAVNCGAPRVAGTSGCCWVGGRRGSACTELSPPPRVLQVSSQARSWYVLSKVGKHLKTDKVFSGLLAWCSEAVNRTGGPEGGAAQCCRTPSYWPGHRQAPRGGRFSQGVSLCPRVPRADEGTAQRGVG